MVKENIESIKVYEKALTDKEIQNEKLIGEYYQKLPKEWGVRELEDELIQKQVCLISLYKQARQIECLTKALERKIEEQK